jgi:diaminopimelate epimerase
MLNANEYIRSHALGNDYLVIDGARFDLPLNEARVRRICDRHTGVGSDGILLLTPPPTDFDVAVRIFNPDGSEAEKSGNGVRIFAKFCFDHGYASGKQRLRIHTLGGPVGAEVIERPRARSVLRVSMGHASFRCADLPMTGATEWVQKKLRVGDADFTATCISVGNPHAVLLDAPFNEETLLKYGPLVENHAQFPRRTNVQLVSVVDRKTVRALIWERGAGRTESSGSSACAVAAAVVKAGLTDHAVDVVMPGGTLQVVVGKDWSLEQVGWAQEIARGIVSEDLRAELAAL